MRVKTATFILNIPFTIILIARVAIVQQEMCRTPSIPGFMLSVFRQDDKVYQNDMIIRINSFKILQRVKTDRNLSGSCKVILHCLK